jgi:hypothetical protein
VELFMQAGFARYGEEAILFRPGQRFPALRAMDPLALGIRPAVSADALELARLYRRVTPAPVAQLEGYRLPDWEHLRDRSSVPRTSLTPILRFADVEAWVQEASEPGGGLAAMLHIGVAKEQQPHYMRVLSLPGHDPDDLIRYGLALIGRRSGSARSPERAHGHGVMSCVRTYESPVDRRFEEQGMETIARVSLLIKEALVRVAEPTLVPAV